MPKIYTIKEQQFVPVSLEKAWEFFSTPNNLSKITPQEIDFKIISEFYGSTMYPGQIIQYYVRPLLGIKMHWVTEITQVEDKKFFIDEQRFGPYAFWHHQHHFEEVEGGVNMIDIVHYAIPMGLIGRLMNKLLIAKEVKGIFTYRKKFIESHFN